MRNEKKHANLMILRTKRTRRKKKQMGLEVSKVKVSDDIVKFFLSKVWCFEGANLKISDVAYFVATGSIREMAPYAATQ